MQIRLGERDVAITMRTLGCDRELALGLPFSEGLLMSPDQIADIGVDDSGAVTVTLAGGHVPNLDAPLPCHFELRDLRQSVYRGAAHLGLRNAARRDGAPVRDDLNRLRARRPF
ncbi:MAG: hypothetical protein ABI833_02135 [Acidobacteriota bacterium]